VHYGPVRAIIGSWPVGVVALPFAAVYWFLFWFFPDSIAAHGTMQAYTNFPSWGGVEALFLLNSAVCGWLGVVVSENRTGVAGLLLVPIALPWSSEAIVLGFWLPSMFLGGFSNPMWDMLLDSLTLMFGAAALRAYVGGITY